MVNVIMLNVVAPSSTNNFEGCYNKGRKKFFLQHSFAD
jgi:hypothetical protein